MEEEIFSPFVSSQKATLITRKKIPANGAQRDVPAAYTTTTSVLRARSAGTTTGTAEPA